MTYKVSRNYMVSVGHPNRCGVKLEQVRALVIHYTGNVSQGADDIANARYFGRQYEFDNNRYEEKNTDREFSYASAHYTVDQDSIQLAIPEDELAYHVGSKTYTPFAREKFQWLNPKTRKYECKPNMYTIGIEMCVNKGNDWAKTIELTAELSADIMIKYNLKIDQLIRHYDVTYKVCPKPFVDNPKAWQDFKALVLKKINEKKNPTKGGFSIMDYNLQPIAQGVLNITTTPISCKPEPSNGAINNGTLKPNVKYPIYAKTRAENLDWYLINIGVVKQWVVARFINLV